LPFAFALALLRCARSLCLARLSVAALARSLARSLAQIPKWTRAKYEIATGEEFNPIKQDTKNGKLRNYNFGDMLFNYGAFPQTWEVRRAAPRRAAPRRAVPTARAARRRASASARAGPRLTRVRADARPATRAAPPAGPQAQDRRGREGAAQG
jgi:hypothetical protein